MALKSQSAFDLVKIVNHYTSPSPLGKPPDTKIDFDRSHESTTLKRLYMPRYLYTALQTSRLHLATSHDTKAQTRIDISVIISSILCLGFDKIFSNSTTFQDCIDHLQTLRQAIYCTNNACPRYLHIAMCEWSEMRIPALPSTFIDNVKQIRPRLPNNILAAIERRDEELHIGTDVLIVLMLLKVMSTQTFLRTDDCLSIVDCLNEVENFLQQRNQILNTLLCSPVQDGT